MKLNSIGCVNMDLQFLKNLIETPKYNILSIKQHYLFNFAILLISNRACCKQTIYLMEFKLC